MFKNMRKSGLKLPNVLITDFEPCKIVEHFQTIMKKYIFVEKTNAAHITLLGTMWAAFYFSILLSGGRDLLGGAGVQ